MKSSYTKTACSICEKPIANILDLGSTPLADHFVNSPDDHEEIFPLIMQFCPDCGLAQLSEIVDDKILFKNDYAFFTGGSPSAVKHFEQYASSMIRQFPQQVAGFTVEIASNDGTFLKSLNEQGANKVLGIDPADSVQSRAKHNGISTVHGFFNTKNAQHIVISYGKADLIVANNVLAHVDDLKDFANGIDTLLSDDGVFVCEFQYFPELVMKNLFDNVYHEHRYYLSINPVQKLFKEFGLEVFKVEDVDTQGGSVRVYIGRNNRKIDDSVITRLLLESMMAEYVGSIQERADSVKRVLRPLIEKLVAQGKTIYAYGASAKGNTLLNFCNITPDLVPFIVDKTPYKFGKYSPGMNLRVLDDQTAGNPDYYLLLVHNYYQSVLARETVFIESGGKFIIPVPSIQII